MHSSTAIYCMDFEQGFELIQSIEGSEAMWIFKDKSIRYEFEALIKK